MLQTPRPALSKPENSQGRSSRLLLSGSRRRGMRTPNQGQVIRKQLAELLNSSSPPLEDGVDPGLEVSESKMKNGRKYHDNDDENSIPNLSPAPLPPKTIAFGNSERNTKIPQTPKMMSGRPGALPGTPHSALRDRILHWKQLRLASTDPSSPFFLCCMVCIHLYIRCLLLSFSFSIQWRKTWEDSFSFISCIDDSFIPSPSLFLSISECRTAPPKGSLPSPDFHQRQSILSDASPHTAELRFPLI